MAQGVKALSVFYRLPYYLVRVGFRVNGFVDLIYQPPLALKLIGLCFCLVQIRGCAIITIRKQVLISFAYLKIRVCAHFQRGTHLSQRHLTFVRLRKHFSDIVFTPIFRDRRYRFHSAVLDKRISGISGSELGTGKCLIHTVYADIPIPLGTASKISRPIIIYGLFNFLLRHLLFLPLPPRALRPVLAQTRVEIAESLLPPVLRGQLYTPQQ